MLAYQAIEYYEFILETLTDYKSTMEPFLKFGEKHQTLSMVSLDVIAVKTSKIGCSVNNESRVGYVFPRNDNDSVVEDIFNSINAFANGYDFMGSIRHLSLVETKITEYKDSNSINDNIYNNLFATIHDANNSLQSYLQTRDKGKGIQLANKAMHLYELYTGALQHYSESLSLIEHGDGETVPEDKAVLELQLLQINLEYSEFVSILSAIKEIYNQLCIVSHNSDTKLEIIKIESGSLLSKILGDNNIIEALSHLLHKAIDLCFSKYTQEGKRTRTSDLIELLDRENQLVCALEANGIDVQDAKENMSQSIGIISKNLLLIAQSGSPKIKVNKETIELDTFYKQKYLTEAQMKYLRESQDGENETLQLTEGCD